MEISAILRIKNNLGPSNYSPSQFFNGTLFIVEDGLFPELYYAGGGTDSSSRANYIIKVEVGVGTLTSFELSSVTLVTSGGAITRKGTLSINLKENTAVLGTFGSSLTIPVFTTDQYGFITQITDVPADQAGGTVKSFEIDSDDLNLFPAPTPLGPPPPPAPSPTPVPSPTPTPTPIFSDKFLFGTGANDRGQIGYDNDFTTTLTFFKLTDLERWKDGDSYYHTICLRATGEMYGAGNGLGTGRTDLTPSLTKLNDDLWNQVAVGEDFTMAIRSDNTLWATGINRDGQLGTGNYLEVFQGFLKIGNDSNWSYVACGKNFTIAIKSDGTAWATGNNSNYQLGLGISTAKLNTFTQITSPSKFWVKASCGDGFMAIQDNTGAIYTVGLNDYGQLGLKTSATTVNNLAPVIIPLNKFIAFACGTDHLIAIQSGGALFGCGNNSQGALGNKQNFKINNTLIQIGTETNWNHLSAGNQSSAVVNNGGVIYTTGNVLTLGYRPSNLTNPVYTLTSAPAVTNVSKSFGKAFTKFVIGDTTSVTPPPTPSKTCADLWSQIRVIQSQTDLKARPYDITSGNGIVVVSENSASVLPQKVYASKNNGQTWQSGKLIGDGPFAVDFIINQFLAFNLYNTAVVMSSSDGVTWTNTDIPISPYINGKDPSGRNIYTSFFNNVGYGVGNGIIHAAYQFNLNSLQTTPNETVFDLYIYRGTILTSSINVYRDKPYFEITPFRIAGLSKPSGDDSSTWYLKRTNIVFGNGTYVFNLFETKKLAISTDGISWVLVDKPTRTGSSDTNDLEFYEIVFGPEGFLAITNDFGNGSVLWASENGIDWYPQSSLPFNVNVPDRSTLFLSVGNNYYILGGTGTSNEFALSYDGQVWVVKTIPFKHDSRAFLKSVTYKIGYFVSITSSTQNAAITPCNQPGLPPAPLECMDKGWSISYLPFNANWSDIVFGEKLVVVAAGSQKYATTPDFNIWTTRTFPTTPTDKVLIEYGEGKYVVLFRGTNQCYVSSNAVIWTPISLAITANWSQLIHAENRFVALADNSTIGLYSDDGLIWNQMDIGSSAEITAIAHGQEKFVALTPSQPYFIYSNNGITWTKKYSYEAGGLPQLNWTGLAYGESIGFVALALGNAEGYYSQDGITWDIYNKTGGRFDPKNFSQVAYATGLFLIQSNQGGYLSCSYVKPAFCSSIDAPPGNGWGNLYFAQDRFFLLQSNLNAIATSICKNIIATEPLTPTPLGCDQTYLPPYPTPKIITGNCIAPPRKLYVLSVAYDYPFPGQQDARYYLVDSATGKVERCLQVYGMKFSTNTYGGMDIKYRTVSGYHNTFNKTTLSFLTFTYITGIDYYAGGGTKPRLKADFIGGGDTNGLVFPRGRTTDYAGLNILVRRGLYVYDSASLPLYSYKWSMFNLGGFYGAPQSLFSPLKGYSPIMEADNSNLDNFSDLFCMTFFAGQSPQTNIQYYNQESFGIGSAPKNYATTSGRQQFAGGDVLYRINAPVYGGIATASNTAMVPILALPQSLCGRYRKIFYDPDTDGLFFTQINDLYYCKLVRDSSTGIPINVTAPCFVSTLMVPLTTIYGIGIGDNLYDNI